jgi:hypothetical protein
LYVIWPSVRSMMMVWHNASRNKVFRIGSNSGLDARYYGAIIRFSKAVKKVRSLKSTLVTFG